MEMRFYGYLDYFHGICQVFSYITQGHSVFVGCSERIAMPKSGAKFHGFHG